MRMEMMGHGDITKLRETCESNETENNADSDAGGTLVGQIHETFLNNKITDMCVMRPDILDHYVVMESDGLEQLRTIFEGMDIKNTVIMISTRRPNNRWGIAFQFHAAKIKTMVQVREISVVCVDSKGGETTSNLDPVDWETSLIRATRWTGVLQHTSTYFTMCAGAGQCNK